MVTAILSALPQEQSGLHAALQQAQQQRHAGRVFWQGYLHGAPVVLALSGVGKVAAATTATALIERFGVQRIVFTGVAGGVGDGVQVGDVVIASHYVQHDMDASPLFARWEVPGYGVANLPCDAPLTALLHQASQRSMAASFPQTRVHCGLIASGDQFISCAQGVQALRQALHSAGHPVLAVEMEGAAVAQVCTDYAIAFAAMRSISDRADDSAHGDFSHFVQHVASRYADSILSELLHSL